MKIICAWCDKDMGEVDGEGVEGVSHGICDECLKKIEAEEGLTVSEEEPVTEVKKKRKGKT